MAHEKKQGRHTNASRRGGHSAGRGHSALFAPVAFVLICLSVILAMSIFFRVNEIEVVGNQTYTTEEVVEASGIDVGDNLFFINQIAFGSHITNRLPYLQDATVERKLPDKIIITVTESSAIACVQSGNGLWLIDRSCKLMGTVSQEESGAFLLVSGVEPIEPSVGDVMELGVEDAGKVSYLSEILTEIDVRELEERVTDLDITSVANPTFAFDGRFQVKLGSKSDTQQKFGILLNAVGQLAPGDTGTIDLSIDKKAHFMQS